MPSVYTAIGNTYDEYTSSYCNIAVCVGVHNSILILFYGFIYYWISQDKCKHGNTGSGYFKKK